MSAMVKRKQKKYFVSLCLKVPVNFEVEVKTSSEKEAFEKAYDMFDGYEEGCISEPIWEEMELDLGGRNNVNSPGVYIEEID